MVSQKSIIDNLHENLPTLISNYHNANKFIYGLAEKDAKKRKLDEEVVSIVEAIKHERQVILDAVPTHERLKKEVANLEVALKKKQDDLASFEATQKRRVEQTQLRGARMKEIQEKRKNLHLQITRLQKQKYSVALDQQNSINALFEFANVFKLKTTQSVGLGLIKSIFTIWP